MDIPTFTDYVLHDLLRSQPEKEIKRYQQQVAWLVDKYGKRVINDALTATKDKRHSGEPARDEMAYFIGCIRKMGDTSYKGRQDV